MEKIEFYTIKEVMKILKVSRLTIYRYIKSRKLKTYKLGLVHRIKKEDFKNFLKEFKA